MEHEAFLGSERGYRLHRTVSVDDDFLIVQQTLKNKGKHRIVTPFYSHHFFTADGKPVGPGYELQLELAKVRSDIGCILAQSEGVLWCLE